MLNHYSINTYVYKRVLIISAIFIIILNYTQYAHSQALNINNGAKMTVTNNTMLSSEGNLALNGELDFTTTGTTGTTGSTLNLKGDFTGIGTLNLNDNKLVLAGDNNQDITYNLSNININTLEIKGNGEKNINNSITVKNKLLLEKGVLNMNDNTFISDGTIEEGNNQSYIKGKLQQKIATDTKEAVFPIGQQQYSPIKLKNITAKSETKIAMTVVAENPNAIIDPKSIINNVSATQYWKKEQIEPATPVLIGQIALWLNDNNTHNIIKGNATVIAGESTNTTFINLFNSRNDDQNYITTKENYNENQQVFALAAEKNFDNLDCIPSAFANNANNDEDKVIKIYCPSIENDNFIFQVFNKWGAIIWETSDADTMTNKGWNGISTDGQDLPPGAYDFIAKGKYVNGKTFVKQGILYKID